MKYAGRWAGLPHWRFPLRKPFGSYAKCGGYRATLACLAPPQVANRGSARKERAAAAEGALWTMTSRKVGSSRSIIGCRRSGMSLMPLKRLSEAHRRATDVSEPRRTQAVKMRASESLRGVERPEVPRPARAKRWRLRGYSHPLRAAGAGHCTLMARSAGTPPSPTITKGAQ